MCSHPGRVAGSSAAYLRDDEYSSERVERGPVGPGWIGFGEQRDELLPELLIFLLVEPFTYG